MTAEEIQLRYEMSKRTDEELLMIAGVNSADYRREALNIAGEELIRRGIPFTSAGEIESGYRFKSEVEGVGGWLLFLCLRLTIIGPLFLLGTIWAALTDNVQKQYSTAFTQAPIFTTILIVIVGSIYFGPMLFGMYAGFALWTVRKYAVGLAKIASVLYIGLNLFEITLLLVLPGPAAQQQPGQNATGIFMNVWLLMGNVLWYLYLSMSVRVKNTYGKRK